MQCTRQDALDIRARSQGLGRRATATRLSRLLLITLAGISSLRSSAANAQNVSGEKTVAVAGGDNSLGIPDLKKVFPPAADAQGVTASMAVFVLMTVLALAPAILVMMTSFTRIVIVLALLRQAIGTQQLPPSQVTTGIALIMTAVVMAPTWQAIQQDAVDPYMGGKLSQRAALDKAAEPLRRFMIRQIENARNEDDVFMFVEHSRGKPLSTDAPLRWSEVRMWELV